MLKRHPKRLAANLFTTTKNYVSVVVIFGVIVLAEGCKKNDFAELSNAANSQNLSQAAVAKPNIILILGDDVGYEIPTVNGGQSYVTRTIDSMAAVGMRFTQMRTTPLCSPSRFELLTGKYNFRNYSLWGS